MKNKIITSILISFFLISNVGIASETATSSQQTVSAENKQTTDNTTEKQAVTKTKATESDEVPIGNKIDENMYPNAGQVAPIIDEVKKSDDTKVIQGSIEKTIDVTLEECIKFALGNNPQIREAIEEISASDARIKQAWSSFFPQFTWTTNGSRNRNLLFSDAIGASSAVYNYYILGQISVSQMIYDFGITQNQVTIKKLGYKTAQENLTSVVNDVIKETKDKYYGLLYAYENLKAKSDNVEKFELFYNQAKALYEIGLNPKVDVTIAEVNLSDAKLQKIQAQKNLDVAIAELNFAMGIPHDTRFNVHERLEYAPCDITLEDAMLIAEESRPDLKIAKLMIESARQNVKLTKKSYFPKITAQGNIAVGGSEPTSNWGYAWGGYLDFPMINVLNINQQIKEQKALYSKQMANSTRIEQKIALEIQSAYYTLIERQNQLPVAFLGMKQAKENYEISFGRYKVGVGNPIELKDAQIVYMNAQLSYYNALYQYNSAKANLEKAIGKNLMFGEEVVDLSNAEDRTNFPTSPENLPEAKK